MQAFAQVGIPQSTSLPILAQSSASASWIDVAILLVMSGLAIFAVCRSTRRQ